jgi:hypothetical protein
LSFNGKPRGRHPKHVRKTRGKCKSASSGRQLGPTPLDDANKVGQWIDEGNDVLLDEVVIVVFLKPGITAI